MVDEQFQKSHSSLLFRDPVSRTARVEAGATWSDVDQETQAFRLAMIGGIDSGTGMQRQRDGCKLRVSTP
jgi:hypothetical protein